MEMAERIEGEGGTVGPVEQLAVRGLENRCELGVLVRVIGVLKIGCCGSNTPRAWAVR